MNKSLWIRATLICGSLDILYAIAMTIISGDDALKMLAGLASGPLGGIVHGWGIAGSIVGLNIHFIIMAIMVAVFLLLVQKTFLKRLNPWLVGSLYGIGLYLVMYGVVLPLRFNIPFPPADLINILKNLFPHIVLVGLPLAIMEYKSRTSLI